MAQIIDGKVVSAKKRGQIKDEAEKLTAATGIVPGLAVVIVGSDPASQVYVRNKHKACGELGFYSVVHELPAETTQEELSSLVEELNADERIHGILVQFPLPKHLDEDAIVKLINPDKDVDALHPYNIGRIVAGDYILAPCTPSGVMVMLEDYGISVSGKEVVVVGRSNLAGKPQALLMLHANATVTICHSRTTDLPSVTRRADIIVVAIGKKGFLTGDMIKQGAVVVDIGINRAEDGKLYGDADFASCAEKASYITPVPGGVGVMTITMLMNNTLNAAKAFAARM